MAKPSIKSCLLCCQSTRETDVIGWYKDQATVGAIFTGLLADEKNSILSTILTRVSTTLRDNLTLEQFNQVSISFHFFPDDWDHDTSGRPSNPALYPDLSSRDRGRRSLLGIKRLMDIVGSTLALILCTLCSWWWHSQSKLRPKARSFLDNNVSDSMAGASHS